MTKPAMSDTDKAAAEAAFEAARASLREKATTPNADGAPSRPVRDEKTANRWRTRNARRRAAGLVEYSEAEQMDLDAKAGVGPTPSVSASSPGVSPSSDAQPKPPGKLTRVELESELVVLREKESARNDADLQHAIGSTFGIGWDTVRKFTPSPSREIPAPVRMQLGAVWAPVLAPRLAKVAHAMPIVAAIAATYEALSPLVREAMTEPVTAPQVAVGGGLADVKARDEVTPAPSAPVVPAAPKAAPLPQNFGYTASPEGGDLK
jgi:hypothetical protein